MTPADPESRWMLPSASLRARLTLWMIVIFAVVELTLGLVFFLYQRQSIESKYEQRLIHEANRYLERLKNITSGYDDNLMTNWHLESARFLVFGQFHVMLHDEQQQIVGTSLHPVPESALLPVAEALRTGYTAVRDVPVEIFDLYDPTATSVKAASSPLVSPDGETYVLTVAATNTSTIESLHIITRVLLLAVPIGVVAAAVAGWFISGIALAPLTAVRKFARDWSPESIGQAVEIDSLTPELAELTQELEDARARLEQGYRSQERFMSNVSHELKTPISIIMAQAQTTELPEASDELRAFVASVIEEMRRLGGLVDSFLMLTRVREGRAEALSRRSQMIDVVMEAVSECAPLSESHQVYLVPRFDLTEDEVDAAVMGDFDLLRTMLGNLIRNAIRFSPAGESVIIDTQLDRDQVLIRVRDHGPGIPESLLPCIFDRFAQSDQEQLSGRGHGLGLEIALGVAELHGGTIRVKNNDDVGCTFTAQLPLRPEKGEHERSRLED